MPTYGLEDMPEPRRSGILDQDDLDRVYSAVLNVRDECAMDLSDTAVMRLVDVALREYRKA